MKIIFKFLLSFFIILLAGCNVKTPVIWEYKQVDSLYKVEIPDYLHVTSSINPLATLQYADTINGFFCMLIAEEKQRLVDSGYTPPALKEYSDLVIGNYMKAKGKGILLEKKQPIKISKRDALLYHFKVTHKGADYKLLYAVTEGKKAYYQLAVWVPYVNKDRHADDMNRIIGSFREL